ncbi:MAG: hypothetical protein V7638_658 [Acidobacteriota bacterium]
MKTDLKHGLVTDQILRVFYDVYNELGTGFWSPFTIDRWCWRLNLRASGRVVVWIFRFGSGNTRSGTS